MNARTTIAAHKRDLELADLAAAVLGSSSLEQARQLTLQLATHWLASDQGFWIHEPRHIQPTLNGPPLIMSAQPFDMAAFAMPLVIYRPHNYMMQQAVQQPYAGVMSPTDFASRRELRLNPFWNEVSRPLGFSEMVGVEVDHGPSERGSVYALVLGREIREHTNRERYWLNRLYLTILPLIQHLREHHASESLIQIPGLGDGAETLPLTPREREVLQWMLEGKRNKEIAIILQCSHSTIKKHVASILHKTHAETRTAAVRSYLVS
jgi:DNA-binding CsgD family transcriptional regulator